MRISYLIFLVSLLFTFSACQEKNKTKVVCIVTDSYPSGAVRGTLCTETQSNKQIIRRFHESGKLLAIVPAKDSLKHGTGVAFYENGDTASILQFENGKMNGVQRWYEGGCLSRMNVYKNDILEAEEYDFFSNGVLMNYFYRYNGEILFHAFFDEYGSFVVDTGFALFQVYAACNNISLSRQDTINVGDTIDLLISTPNPLLKNMCLDLKLETHNYTTGEKTYIPLTIADNHLVTNHKIVLSQRGRYYFAVYLDVVRTSTQYMHTCYSDFEAFVR